MEHIVYLKPDSPFHIGEAGVGLEETSATVHSDTLFSALCNMYALLYGEDELKTMLTDFKKEKPFLVSSAFLHAHGIPIFPIPRGINLPRLMMEKEGRIEDYELSKRLGKIQFVSKDIFLSIMKEKPQIPESTRIIQNILFAEHEKPPERIFVVNEIPRIALDRISSASSIYHVGEVHYAPKCGLYFFLRTTPQYDKRITASIKLLGDEGLGGKRSSGKGFFTPTFQKNSIRIPYSNMKMTLSLIFPQENEIPLVKNGYYSIILRKGWVYTPLTKSLRKKGVRMLAEGSQFPGRVVGEMAEVIPGTEEGIPTILRYGLGYYLMDGGNNE